MKSILLFYLAALAGYTSFSQNPWVVTSSVNTERYDDISFLSPDTGWAVGTTVPNQGKIYHTTDGGQSWNIQKTIPNYIRSIEFADKNIGFAGALSGNGQNVFFRTTDGGLTWTNISSVITGTNRGICGICCVNTSITYAVGVWSSPAYVMKTTDGGNTWTQLNMSSYANALVDVQFTDANNGYVTGQSNVTGEGAVVLKTTDGGTTWTKVFTSNKAGEFIWKLQNLDGQNWFGSIQAAIAYNDSTSNEFIKSTDGGNTWVVKPAPFGHYFQGIGFMDTQKGWIGNAEFFETSDGGNTWTRLYTNSTYNAFDRFQKVNAHTAYFSSNFIYKIENYITTPPPTTTTVKEQKGSERRKWLTVFPNPVKDEIACQLDLPNKTMFALKVLSSKNEIIWEKVDEKEKGIYSFKIDRRPVPGIYYVYVMFNEHAECEKVIIE